ncbi:hypothetical protein [Microbacterium sp. KNMS]
MSASERYREQQIAKLDAMLDAGDYQGLDLQEATFARLAVAALAGLGDLEAAREWAELSCMAKNRIETLFERRKARDAEEARALGVAE